MYQAWPVKRTDQVYSIGMGQRYDVIVQANMSSVASDFWLRAVPDTFCSDNDNPDDIKGIIHYGGKPPQSPNLTPALVAWDSKLTTTSLGARQHKHPNHQRLHLDRKRLRRRTPRLNRSLPLPRRRNLRLRDRRRRRNRRLQRR